MRITDELREWWIRKFPVMDKKLHEDFTAIADRIDAEHERQLANEWIHGVKHAQSDDAMAKYGYVKLPVDADGEPWHLGDELTMDGEVCEVVGIGDKTIFYAFLDGVEWTIAHNNHHYHASTVEDVLREFAEQYAFYSAIEGGIHPDLKSHEEVLRQFAAKLQLRGDEK